jgi:hypothetical protein
MAASDAGAVAPDALDAFERAVHAALARSDGAGAASAAAVGLARLPRDALLRVRADVLRRPGARARGAALKQLAAAVTSCASGVLPHGEDLLSATRALAQLALARRREIDAAAEAKAAAQPSSASISAAASSFASSFLPPPRELYEACCVGVLASVLSLPPSSAGVCAARIAAMECVPTLLHPGAARNVTLRAVNAAVAGVLGPSMLVCQSLFRIIMTEADGAQAIAVCQALARMLRVRILTDSMCGGGASLESACVAFGLAEDGSTTTAHADIHPAKLLPPPYTRVDAVAAATWRAPRVASPAVPRLAGTCEYALRPLLLSSGDNEEDAAAVMHVLVLALLGGVKVPPAPAASLTSQHGRMHATVMRVLVGSLSTSKDFCDACTLFRRQLNDGTSPVDAPAAATLSRGAVRFLGNEQAVMEVCAAVEMLTAVLTPQDGTIQLLLAAAQAHPGSPRVHSEAARALCSFLLRNYAAVHNENGVCEAYFSLLQLDGHTNDVLLLRELREATASGTVTAFRDAMRKAEQTLGTSYADVLFENDVLPLLALLSRCPEACTQLLTFNTPALLAGFIASRPDLLSADADGHAAAPPPQYSSP